MVKKMLRVNKSLNRIVFFVPDRVELGSLSLLNEKKILSHESHFRETKSKTSPSSVSHPISWFRIILKS